jgi:hypothetical protein
MTVLCIRRSHRDFLFGCPRFRLYKGGECIRMRGQTVKQLALLLVAWLLLGNEIILGHAEQITAGAGTLPRSFQGARLGMSQYDLVTIAPELNRTALGANRPLHKTLIIPSKDRYLQRVEYRFHHGLLRELAIYYKRNRVPRGYEGLLSRLTETYGQPVEENVEEQDSSPDVLSVRKTVWKDHATMSVLAESHKMRQGREAYDLVLTMTDLDLQQAYEQDQERGRRQQESRIPIPLSEQVTQKKRSVEPPVNETKSRTAG